jgi:hypothetical protein
MSQMSHLYTTLIRTHHVKSLKKLEKVTRAAEHNCVRFVLVRYGGPPGLMYAENAELPQLQAWLGEVRRLRYKEFQVIQKPVLRYVTVPGELPAVRGQTVGSDSSKPAVQALVTKDMGKSPGERSKVVQRIDEFQSEMASRGLLQWFNSAMGYSSQG